MSNGTSKPRRAMQLAGALIAVAGLVATITAYASAQDTPSRYYSGVISGPDYCLNASLGGPRTYPFDSDRDGVADTCSLPRSRRETAARQNAMERLGGELALYFGQLFADECTKVAETFGEPAAEATDECAAPRAAHASGRALPAVPQAPIPPETTSPRFFSGPVVTSSVFCLDRSFGGPVTYPFDVDGDGVADICALPRTRRAAVARQNAFERLASEQEPYFLLLVAEECLRVPGSFGEPLAEAADVCATGATTPTESETGDPLPTPNPGGTRPGGGTGGTRPDPGGGTPTITPPTAPVATNPGTYNRRAARNLRFDPGPNQIAVSWDPVPSTQEDDDSRTNLDTNNPYGHADVYEYEVWWAQKGQGWSTTNRYITPDQNTQTYTITGLNDRVTYNIRVKAVRGPSGDPFTPTLTSTPGLAGPPVWPADNALTSPFFGRITADWNPPLDTNSDDNIASYVIQWSTSPSGWSTTRQATTAVGTTEYTITGLSNGSYYVRVQGVNSAGPGTWSLTEMLRLTATRPSPGQPTELTLTTAANSQLTATWMKPSSTNEPTHYQVQWRNVTARENWATSREHTVVGADTLTATVPPSGSLIPSNTYEVRVRAINQDIAGSWSSLARIVLGQAAAPRNLRLDPNGGHQILVTWDTATSVPAVLSYNLQWDTSSGFASNCQVDASCTQVPKASSDVNHQLSSLDNNTIYYVRIQSVNANGPGPWSPTQSVKPGALQAPGSPAANPVTVVADADHKKLHVTWTSGSETGKSPLTGFTIQYRRTGTTSWSSSRLSDFDDRTDTTYNCTSGDIDGDIAAQGASYGCTLTGLLSAESYDVRIRARNSFGEGPWSTTATGTPASGRLAAPQSVSAADEAGQSGSLEVTWQQADEPPKPPVSSFEMRRCHTPSGGSETCSIFGVGRPTPQSGVYTYVIRGLTNGTDYTVSVRARNTHGYSDWASAGAVAPTNTN